MKLVDLSHPIEAGMVTYPGLPGPVLSDHLSRADSASRYAAGTTFHLGRIDMVANTGTYLDAPFHRFEDGVDLAGLPLERFVELPGLLIDATGRRDRGIPAALLAGHSVWGRAVLIRTGWDAHWRTPRYGEGHPYLTAEAAQALVDGAAALVGIDSLNIDDTADGARPAHTKLLAAGIPIVEHLTNLDRLPAEDFRFSAAPAPVRGVGNFPVRAYAAFREVG